MKARFFKRAKPYETDRFSRGQKVLLKEHLKDMINMTDNLRSFRPESQQLSSDLGVRGDAIFSTCHSMGTHTHVTKT